MSRTSSAAHLYALSKCTHAASLAVAYYIFSKASPRVGPGPGNRSFKVEGNVKLDGKLTMVAAVSYQTQQTHTRLSCPCLQRSIVRACSNPNRHC